MEDPMRSASPLQSLARGYAVPLLLLAGSGCGDDGAGPAAADVSGVYDVMSVSEEAACVPADAFDLLAPTVGGATLHFTIRVDDLGDQVRFTVLAVEEGTFDPTIPPTLAQLDRDGSIRLTPRRTTDRVILQGRTFFDDAGGTIYTGSFDREAHPITFDLSGQATQVFREGAADAPVFATCSQLQHETGIRRGD
jgi:hypothetical protein